MLRLRFEHNCARSISKQHAGAPVGPIENTREGLSANDNGPPELACLQEIISDRHRKHKPRANRLYVESGALRDAEHLLNAHGGSRKSPVRRCGCANNQVDIYGIDTGANERLFCSCRAKIAGQFVIASNVALANARTLANPFIRRIDDF